MKLITSYNIKPYYLIDENGNIFSKKSKMFLHQYDDKDGYKKVTLMRNDGSWSPFSVHRLLALEYIPNPQHKEQINHKDFNRKNNNVENLEWVSHLENQMHSVNFGAKKNVGYKKLSDDDVRKIRKSNLSNRVLGRLYKVNQKTIYNVRKYKIYKYVCLFGN